MVFKSNYHTITTTTTPRLESRNIGISSDSTKGIRVMVFESNYHTGYNPDGT